MNVNGKYTRARGSYQLGTQVPSIFTSSIIGKAVYFRLIRSSAVNNEVFKMMRGQGSARLLVAVITI